jgi:hypothetical protein
VPSGPLALHRGKGRLQIRPQLRLVVLHREQVVAACRHDLRAQLALGEQRIARHEAVAQGHLGQHAPGGGHLLPLPPRADLGQHDPRLVGVGGHQMDARRPLPVDAPQLLAVHGDGVRRGDPARPQPGPHRLLEGGHVEGPEDPVQGGHAGAPPGRQPQGHEHLRIILRPLPPPLRHGVQTARSAEDRHHGELQQRHQRQRGVGGAPPVRPAGLGHGRERRRQRARWGGRGQRKGSGHRLLLSSASWWRAGLLYRHPRVMKRP